MTNTMKPDTCKVIRHNLACFNLLPCASRAIFLTSAIRISKDDLPEDLIRDLMMAGDANPAYRPGIVNALIARGVNLDDAWND